VEILAIMTDYPTFLLGVGSPELGGANGTLITIGNVMVSMF